MSVLISLEGSPPSRISWRQKAAAEFSFALVESIFAYLNHFDICGMDTDEMIPRMATTATISSTVNPVAVALLLNTLG